MCRFYFLTPTVKKISQLLMLDHLLDLLGLGGMYIQYTVLSLYIMYIISIGEIRVFLKPQLAFN